MTGGPGPAAAIGSLGRLLIEQIIKGRGGIGMDRSKQFPGMITKIFLQLIAAEKLFIKGGNQVEMSPAGQIINYQFGQNSVNCFVWKRINKA